MSETPETQTDVAEAPRASRRQKATRTRVVCRVEASVSGPGFGRMFGAGQPVDPTEVLAPGLTVADVLRPEWLETVTEES